MSSERRTERVHVIVGRAGEAAQGQVPAYGSTGTPVMRHGSGVGQDCGEKGVTHEAAS